MRVHVRDTELVDDLIGFLRRCGWVIGDVAGYSVEVLPPAQLHDARLAGLQLDGYLKVWSALHADQGSALPSATARPSGSTV